MQTSTPHDHCPLLPLSLFTANVMVVINRTRKDRCEKAALSQALTLQTQAQRSDAYREGHEGHPHTTNSVSKQCLKYFTPTG